MKARTLLVAVPMAAGVLLLGSAPAGANESHFTGTFNAAITGVNCLTDQVSTSPGADVAGVPLVDPSTFGDASGTWRVNVGTKTASARFVIFINEQPHAAFTLPMTVVSSGPQVVVTGSTGAGDLTVTIANGTMTYRIDGYDSTSFMKPVAAYCPNGYVTYTGSVND